MADSPDRVEAASRELYALAPDVFLERRTELAAAAREAGDASSAKAISKLRKPTVAAWIVNAAVLAEPAIVTQLADLGDQLRTAQDALDAGRLRDLSAQRRSLVGKLTKGALRLAGREQPAAALRDEVIGTFDAAVADPDVAGRLGRLTRAERWSGFGFAGGGTPELTLVRGGRTERPTSSSRKTTAAERRRHERDLSRAREDFAAADAALDTAREGEQHLAREVRRLGAQLAALQRRLDDARDALESARHEVTAARSARRQARSALDRAEREAQA